MIYNDEQNVLCFVYFRRGTSSRNSRRRTRDFYPEEEVGVDVFWRFCTMTSLIAAMFYDWHISYLFRVLFFLVLNIVLFIAFAIKNGCVIVEKNIQRIYMGKKFETRSTESILFICSARQPSSSPFSRRSQQSRQTNAKTFQEDVEFCRIRFNSLWT